MNTKQKTEEKVFSFMQEHHMLKAYDKVVAGVSGGADSVCLLFVLLEYRKRVPFSLAVVHVNHGIRQEAEEDAGYVEELCKTNEIPFYPFQIDVRQKAREQKCSEEEAGRIARYEAFTQVAEEFGAEKIAVAHNCNDRSETLVFNLFRGSGIKGLGSIRPVRDNIIRPILCLERREVEAYLKEQGIFYCQDATNEKDDYTRNRIRHHILPYAEREIAAGCISHMAQTADMLSETEEYLEQQTIAAMQECVRLHRRVDAASQVASEVTMQEASLQNTGAMKLEGNVGAIEIEIMAFLKNHNVIRKRILYAAITSLAASAKDISFVHVKDLLTLFTENGNRKICLPYGIVGRRQYDKVILERRLEEHTAKEFVQEIPICLQTIDQESKLISLPSGEMLECTLLAEARNLREFPSNQYTKWFDYDKIEKSLVLRTRKIGDYLTIAGKDGQILHKSIKDYMITQKIPRDERDRILLLAAGSHVIWMMGYRISEYYKINRNTKHILQVQLIGKGCSSSKTEEENG